MHALPRQHASHSDKKTISISSEKDSCSSALTQKGEEPQRGLPYPERALDLGNAGGDRSSPSPTRPPDPCAIPAISIAAVPQQQWDQNREITGTHSLERARRERNVLQRGKHNQPFFSRELTARAALRRHAAHNDIRSQYVYANNMLVQLLYESSSTPPCPPPRRKTGGASPSLRGEETAVAGFRSQRAGAGSDGKEEDRDSPVFIPASVVKSTDLDTIRY